MHDPWITYRSQLWIFALFVRGTRILFVFTSFVLLLFLRSLLGLEASTKTQKGAQRKKLGQQCNLDCLWASERPDMVERQCDSNGKWIQLGFLVELLTILTRCNHAGASQWCWIPIIPLPSELERHLSPFLACVAQMLLSHWGSCKRNSNRLNQKRSRKLQRPKMPRSLRSARSFGGATSILQEMLNRLNMGLKVDSQLL